MLLQLYHNSAVPIPQSLPRARGAVSKQATVPWEQGEECEWVAECDGAVTMMLHMGGGQGRGRLLFSLSGKGGEWEMAAGRANNRHMVGLTGN